MALNIYSFFPEKSPSQFLFRTIGPNFNREAGIYSSVRTWSNYSQFSRVVDEPLDNSEENVIKSVDENNVKIDVNESDVI